MSTETPLADTLLRHLPDAGRGVALPELEEALREIVARCGRAWPGVTVPEEAFVDHIGSHLCEGDDLAAGALEALHFDELFLSLACARGDSEAIALFESRYVPGIVHALRRSRIADVIPEEVAQVAVTRLLVGDKDKPPRIVQYSGRGELGAWLRVVAVREALMSVRGRRPEVGLEDANMDRIIGDSASDPELAYLQEMYRSQFQAAFAEALSRLDKRSRSVLRYHYLEKITLHRLAAMFQVHRVTISRWLARARDQLIADTLVALRRNIDVSEDEFMSLVRLVHSRADVSIRRLLEDQ